MNYKYWFFLPCFLLLCDMKHYSEKRVDNLYFSNKKYSIWCASVGWNWIFLSDSAFYEFKYLSDQKDTITQVDYGDIIITNQNWFYKSDTIYITVSKQYIEKFPVKYIDTNKFVVRDLQRSWGVDSIVFVRAINQFPAGIETIVKD
jgi:hypothetical protein